MPRKKLTPTDAPPTDLTPAAEPAAKRALGRPRKSAEETPAPSSSFDETPAPGSAEDDLSVPLRRGAATKARREGSWGALDGAVVALALGVMALSLAAAWWLFGR